jgi:nicotinamidase-related amidase
VWDPDRGRARRSACHRRAHILQIGALQGLVGDATLVICGVATECCVTATAFDAADAGCEVVVVADACAGATSTLHEQALCIMASMAPMISVTTSHQS